MTTIATECNVCPKGIVACTHLDGKVVWLADEEIVAAHANFRNRGIGHWATAGPGLPGPCRCTTGHIVMYESVATGYDSLADAVAEYERRCAQLRAGP